MGQVGPEAGSNGLEYALTSGVSLESLRAKRTASARLEVALQSPLQDTFSYTMTDRALLGGG